MNMGEREGERDGLPAGWGPWTQDEDGAMNLSRTGHRYSVRAYRSGEWKLWDGTTYGPRVTGYAKPRTMAAAQHEAEAALWCVDGFGVGEVRGVVATDPDTIEAIVRAIEAEKPIPVALPSLPGLWRLTRFSDARPITVDARKVGEASDPLPCPNCGRRECFAGVNECESAKPIATPESDPLLPADHPLATRPRRVDAVGLVREPFVPSAKAAAETTAEMRRVSEGRELARLMPCRKCNAPFTPPRGGGSHRCPSCGTRNGDPPGEALAFAALCQLAERLDPAIGPNQRRACAEARDDLAAALRERETLRARVAELEAGASAAYKRGALDERAKIDNIVDGTDLAHEEAIEALLRSRARVAELEAAPTGASVAGLLAKVDEARSVASSKGANHAGESAMAYRYEGMRDAFDIARDLIRSALAAPTDPMGKVVAESPPVCPTRLAIWKALGPYDRERGLPPTQRVSCERDKGGCGALPGWPCKPVAALACDAAKGGGRG